MKYLKRIFQIVILNFIFGTAIAQQTPIYSQYIMNGFLINPSLAGRDGYTTVNLTVREQWVGMAGAPSTYALSFQTSLLSNSFISKSQPVRKKIIRPSKNAKVGFGGYVFNDNNGIIRRTGVQMAYAYHIAMGKTELGQSNDLSFGLALTVYQFFLNESGLLYSYADDPYLNTYTKSTIVPDVNFGASYTSKTYYVGFAMTSILRGSLLFPLSSDNKSGELGYYFLTGGYDYKINKDWAIKPSFFLKASDMFFKSMQVDLTTRVFYKDNYWAGLSYRSSDAIIVLLGLKYDKFYFAYAYDYTLSDIRGQTFGTHELTLAVKFGESTRRYRWLNAF
jgi:type IX secretion system PorP/SprF family membrane protein